jgi:cupin fold WbuC family metalloprotein
MTQYKLVDDQLCARLIAQADDSPRKRSHHNLHESTDEAVQRLCIALAPGTYVQPHKHPESYKWEMMLAIQGRVCMLLFDDAGKLLEKIILSGQESVRAIEIPPDTWHTLFPIDAHAVIMEIKQGPYIPLDQENFADWAPAEGSDDVPHFLQWCMESRPGDYYRQ